MQPPVYLGDEVTAAGYRLAGIDARVPAPETATAAFAEARALAPLVMVAAGVAARIDAAQLRVALAALSPLVVIVPDARGEVARPDLAARLRSQLGMEA